MLQGLSVRFKVKDRDDYLLGFEVLHKPENSWVIGRNWRKEMAYKWKPRETQIDSLVARVYDDVNASDTLRYNIEVRPVMKRGFGKKIRMVLPGYDLKIAPNPFSNSKIKYTLAEDEKVEFKILDKNMNVIWSRDEKFEESGDHSIDIGDLDLGNSTYYVIMRDKHGILGIWSFYNR